MFFQGSPWPKCLTRSTSLSPNLCQWVFWNSTVFIFPPCSQRSWDLWQQELVVYTSVGNLDWNKDSTITISAYSLNNLLPPARPLLPKLPGLPKIVPPAGALWESFHIHAMMKLWPLWERGSLWQPRAVNKQTSMRCFGEEDKILWVMMHHHPEVNWGLSETVWWYLWQIPTQYTGNYISQLVSWGYFAVFNQDSLRRLVTEITLWFPFIFLAEKSRMRYFKSYTEDIQYKN